MSNPQGTRHRPSEVVIGVDVGTTMVKAAAFDQVGRVAALVQAATVCETPRPGWVEVEMEGLWRQVAAALRELAGRLGGGHPIRAIGISAFMGGAWLVDRDGRPVRNAIPWHDARAVTVLDELRAAGLLERSFAISCNALTPGQAGTILGSSCLNSVVTERPVWEPAGVGLSFLIPPDRWTRTMPNQTGTLALDWFRRNFDAGGLDAAALDATVAEVPRGARGVLFHPYLNGTGVLAPVYEPRARGRLSGLGLEHTRGDILRAIYEGLAFAVADCLDLLPEFAEPIVLLGGGAHSAAWRRIAADVTGRAFAVASAAEPGALAWHCCGDGGRLVERPGRGGGGVASGARRCCPTGARAEYRPLLAVTGACAAS